MAKPGIVKPKTRAPKAPKTPKGIVKPKAAKVVKAYRGKAKKDVFAKGGKGTKPVTGKMPKGTPDIFAKGYPKGAKAGMSKKLLGGGKGHG